VIGDRGAEPGRDCPLCPRLVRFRAANRKAEPSWWNAPVPSFGPAEARLAIVGLAPGLRGANRTGRPFTGDFAGNLLYATLIEYGFAAGHYGELPDDGLKMIDARVVNAARCVPPQNKPLPQEIRTCNRFLAAEFAELRKVAAIVALGKIAHDAVLLALGEKPSRFAFGHGAVHKLAKARLFDSYHCSRLNTNTGVLTPKMFQTVFANVRAHLGRG
jgi:uracil-DNA glycosylase